MSALELFRWGICIGFIGGVMFCAAYMERIR